MQLDKHRRQELARRRGSTWRTILQLVWLGLNFVAAYFVVEWVYAQGYLTPAMLYRAGVPASVPGWVIQGALMLVLVLVMQFFVVLGFLIANPSGRRRTGRPTFGTWNQELDDDRHG